MSETNLFQQLSGMCRKTRPIVLQPGQKTNIQNPVTGRIQTETVPMPSSQPIRFEIHNLSPNEMIEADNFITERPPAKYQEEPNPRGPGLIKVHVGYDEENPDYLAKRHQQSYLRDAAVCLAGCPALRESTPGETREQKAKTLTESLPAALLGWLANEIDTLTVITAVGEEEVESFLAAGSAAGKSSNAKSASSKGSTAPAGTTKSAKRRTTGG
jgi:hypothetical protein